VKLSYAQTVAVLYTIVLFLDRLDLTMTNITFPKLAQQLNVSVEAVTHVSLAFLLALVLSLPVSSWLGRRFGLKNVYFGAILLFGCGALLSSLAPNLEILVGCRLLQGIGGGLMVPVGMTLLYGLHDKSQYVSITSFAMIPSLVAPAIGPFVGGMLLDTWGWRSVFFFSVPLCAVVAWMISRLPSEGKTKSPEGPQESFDVKGFVTGGSFLLILFFSLSRASLNGIDVQVMTGLLLAVGLLWTFTQVEKKAAHPLVSLSLFDYPLFVRVNWIQAAFQVCHFGSFLFLGIYLQTAAQLSASQAGLILGMQALGAMAVSRYSVYLFHHKGPGYPIGLGLLGIACLTPCVLFIRGPGDLSVGIGLFFLRGLFSGLCGAPIQALSVMGFPQRLLGQATALFNISRQVSISFGVVVASLLLSTGFALQGFEKKSCLLNGLCPSAAVFSVNFCEIVVVALLGVALTRHLKALMPQEKMAKAPKEMKELP
jgi:EmrB/QacA subfamily drug resistance transporter